MSDGIDNRILTDFTSPVTEKKKVYHNLTINRYGNYLRQENTEALIKKALCSQFSIVFIHGTGGMGKSAIVYNILLEIVKNGKLAEESFEKVFWFSDSDSPGNLNLNQVLSGIKSYCECGTSTKSHNTLDDDILEVTTLLSAESKSILVIDNFETITDEKLKDFILKIPTNCKVVIVSKYSPQYYKEHNVFNTHILSSIMDIKIPKVKFEDWISIFEINKKDNIALAEWSNNVGDSLNGILKKIYNTFDGNVFGMLTVIHQFSIRAIYLYDEIYEELNDNYIHEEINERIISDSFGLIKEDSKKFLLAAMLNGPMCLDLMFISKISNLGNAANENRAKMGTPLDKAIIECININLLEVENIDGKRIYYLSPNVYSYIYTRLTGEFCDDHESFDVNKYNNVIDSWINHHLELSKEIGFCYDNTQKLQAFDDENKQKALLFVLDYCYKNELYEPFIEISDNFRYFFYTRVIWCEGEECIHIKRARAAQRIGDNMQALEAFVYYINIACKYRQVDNLVSYVSEVERLVNQENISENVHCDVYFRYMHTKGLYYYAKNEYKKAYDIWKGLTNIKNDTLSKHDIIAVKRWMLKCYHHIDDFDPKVYTKKCLELLEDSKNNNFERSIVDTTLMLVNEYIITGDISKASSLLPLIKYQIDKIQDTLYTARFLQYSGLCKGKIEGEKDLYKAKEMLESLNLNNELKKMEILKLLCFDKSLKITFLRHLPTANNLNNVFLGRYDMDCDVDFINSNIDKIESLKTQSTKYDYVFSSPLKRARYTAELIFENHNIITDDRLIERDLGDWSNNLKKAIQKRHPEAFFNNGRMNFNYTPENGESYLDLIKRTASFLNYLNDNYSSDKHIAVVTHNGIIDTVKSILSGNFEDSNNMQPYITPYEIIINSNNINQIRKFLV